MDKLVRRLDKHQYKREHVESPSFAKSKVEACGFAGALAGGMAGARIGIQAAKLCVVIGIPVGVAVCGVAVVGGSSLAGGLLVGPKLEAAAQLLYEPMP